MNFLSQKKNILKKAVNKKLTNTGFYELDQAEEGLKYYPISPGKRRPVFDINADVDAFGEKNLRNPKFKRKLRQLQEKYNVTAFA